MPHLSDILADHSTMAADILAFVEPWLSQTDRPVLERFNVVSRANCPSTPNSYGSIIFSTSLTRPEGYRFTSVSSGRNGHIDATVWTIAGIQFAMIYSHPTVKFEELTSFLRTIIQSIPEIPTVVLGDFNLDLFSDDRLLKFFLQYRLKERTSRIPSTDYGTKLDACFSNILELDAWFFESLFSDHKPICITIPRNEKLSLLDELDILDEPEFFTRAFNSLNGNSKV